MGPTDAPTATSESADLTRGYALALVSAALLSTTAIFIRYLTQNYRMPPLALALWRDVLVSLTLLTALRLLRPSLLRVERRQLIYLAGYGLVLAVFGWVWTISVALNGAAISTVLLYSSVAYTALLGRWLLKERLDWAKLLAVALSLGGCILVSGVLDAAAWRANLGGILTGILSGLCYSAYSLMGRSAAQRGLNSWTVLVYTFGFAALFLLFLTLSSGLLPVVGVRPSDLLGLGSSWTGWAVLFLLATGPTLSGFGLYNLSLGYLPSSVANLILSLEPVFTAVTAYFLFGERLTGVQIVGSVMILCAMVFLRVYEGWLTRRSRLKIQKGRGPGVCRGA